MTDFVTPPHHIHFLAKRLFGHIGEIIDGSIAYLEKNGGGPETPHTHPHDHLFIVIKGEAKILLEEKVVIVKENESYLVRGSLSHTVWNNVPETTIMIGLSVKQNSLPHLNFC